MQRSSRLSQELRSESVYTVKAIRPEGDKVMRMNAQTGMFEQGLVLLPKQAGWLEGYRRVTCPGLRASSVPR